MDGTCALCAYSLVEWPALGLNTLFPHEGLLPHEGVLSHACPVLAYPYMQTPAVAVGVNGGREGPEGVLNLTMAAGVPKAPWAIESIMQ
eukprot:1149291-Pelagomonas_calceolata.AAC.3